MKLRVSYGKVAEYQARGVVHFHALLRLDLVDPTDPDLVLPPPPRSRRRPRGAVRPRGRRRALHDAGLPADVDGVDTDLGLTARHPARRLVGDRGDQLRGRRRVSREVRHQVH